MYIYTRAHTNIHTHPSINPSVQPYKQSSKHARSQPINQSINQYRNATRKRSSRRMEHHTYIQTDMRACRTCVQSRNHAYGNAYANDDKMMMIMQIGLPPALCESFPCSQHA